MKAKMLLAVAVIAMLSCQKKQSTPVQDEQNSSVSIPNSAGRLTKNDYDSTGIYHNMMLDSALVYALNNRTRNSEPAHKIIMQVYAKHYPVDVALIQKVTPGLLVSINKTAANPLEMLDPKAPEYPFFVQLFKMIKQTDRIGYEQFIADIESLKEKVFINEDLSAQAKERVLGTLAVAGSSAYRWFNLHTINTHLHFFVPFLSPTQVTQGGIEAVSADARAYMKAKKDGHSEHTARVLSAIASVEKFFESLWPF